MSNTNSIGSFLAALRKAKGLTQKQLAEMLNVSDKAISRWERDECAPDLSLIPVLAEIYGVTSDEILRGRRADPGAAPTPQTEEKSKKRLQYFLSRITTRYKIQSLISVGITVVGLIAAMILNAFNRAQAGFLVGCIFFLAAAVCQIIFLILGRSHLNEEEFDEDAVTNCRHTLVKGAEWVFSIITFLFFSTLPLMLANDPYWGLTVPYWTEQALIRLAIPAVLCPLVCYILNLKLGIVKPLSAIAKLRLRFCGIFVLILIITIPLHLLAANWLYEHPNLYSSGTKFDTFEDFKAYMETPLNPSGEPMTFYETKTYPDGTTHRIYIDDAGIYYDAEYSEYILDDPESGFYSANQTVRLTASSGDAIYTYNSHQYNQAQERFILINWLIAVVYPTELAVVFLLYRRKKSTAQ